MSPSQPVHTSTDQLGVLNTSDDLLICCACGTQYEATESSNLNSCRICDDPRQYVRPSGQSFTTLRALRSDAVGYRLQFEPDEQDPNVVAITIQPPTLGIGQRAFLIRTPHGNILWDLVCYLDDVAVSHINSLGGLSAIIISHPHFYTTWADWSATFNNIPVYLAAADQEWLNHRPSSANLQFLTEAHTTILPGITAIIAGGHFPGSAALHTAPPNTKVPSLFHADTIHTIPNAHSPDIAEKTGKGATSFTFMWSIPNGIPLSPDQVLKILKALKGFDIQATYAFTTVRWREGQQTTIPERIVESAKICAKSMGYSDHPIFAEKAM